MVVAMMPSFEEWDAHPHSAAIAKQPLIKLTRVGDALPRKLPKGSRPLEGIRVLELTRIIAGPVCGRTLAVHGADVLRLMGSNVPTVESLDTDTGRGKRSDFASLSSKADLQRLRDLAQ